MAGKGHSGSTQERPEGPYWDDPVYHFLRRQQADAADQDETEAARLDGLVQELVDGAMADDCYWELAEQAQTDRRQRRDARKERRRQAPRRPPVESESAINTAELKRRIYNPQVSRDNVIKALEALPPGQRKATIAGLPPGLRRKLGQYLKDGG
ncbi:MAG: hypothetical protein GKR89_19035 [Candidatus Latescibacteria bacterium]|nr:hypothetical protein [Candidatus Latescibacterota bacterium]